MITVEWRASADHELDEWYKYLRRWTSPAGDDCVVVLCLRKHDDERPIHLRTFPLHLHFLCGIFTFVHGTPATTDKPTTQMASNETRRFMILSLEDSSRDSTPQVIRPCNHSITSTELHPSSASSSLTFSAETSIGTLFQACKTRIWHGSSEDVSIQQSC